MKRIWKVAALAAATSLIVAACSDDNESTETTAAEAADLKVAVVYIGVPGDAGWTYQHEVGRQNMVKALGDKVGIKRYGFFILPMDESLARIVVDVGGRPHLVYEANAPTMFVRDFNIILVKEFCRAFSNALGANLHVQLVYGEEPHHVAEAIFKCLARALDMATQIEPRAADQLPSTKGKI